MAKRREWESTVLVDMDGVLANFGGMIVERLPSHIVRVARSNFYLEQDYPDHIEHVRSIMNHPEFFHTLPVIDGALEGWQRLLDLGYDPRICSAPLNSNLQLVEGKRAWIRQHLVPEFGKRVLERAIIDRQKSNHDGLVLIDDKPKIDTGNGRATWQHVVFDHPYNQHSLAPYRLHGWRDPDLGAILEKARKAN